MLYAPVSILLLRVSICQPKFLRREVVTKLLRESINAPQFKNARTARKRIYYKYDQHIEGLWERKVDSVQRGGDLYTCWKWKATAQTKSAWGLSISFDICEKKITGHQKWPIMKYKELDKKDSCCELSKSRSNDMASGTNTAGSQILVGLFLSFFLV